MKNFKKLAAGVLGVTFAFTAATYALPSKTAEALTYYYQTYTDCQTQTATTNTSQSPYKITYKIVTYKPSSSPTTTTPSKPAPAPAPAPAPKPEPKPEQAPVAAPSSLSAYEQKVVELVNVERQKNGLKPLQSDVELSKVARLKSEDMRDNNYFSHQSPTYGSPFEMMKKFGVSYTTAGENIAAGQKTPEAVVEAWMNSSGHRANILNAKFTHIGVGYVSGGSYGAYWTQQFIGK